MVNEEKHPIVSKMEAIKELLNSEDIQKMWMKMHTPWTLSKPKVGRNQICPYCDSGKKYKNCECYQKKDIAKYRLDNKHTKGWK